MRRAMYAAAILASTTIAAQAGTITKLPDVGPYWQPIKSTGTYVYANSFVADASGSVTSLGTWLLNEIQSNTQQFRFVVLGSIGGNPANGPDISNVLADTGTLSLSLTGSLTRFDAAPFVSAALNAGSTYWFAINEIGLNAPDASQVGGHTQNSDGIVDNGTFWYSNDPTGASFEGQNLTPEMAFSVTIGEVPEPVPEPATLALLGAGLAGLAAARRRRKAT